MVFYNMGGNNMVHPNQAPHLAQVEGLLAESSMYYALKIVQCSFSETRGSQYLPDYDHSFPPSLGLSVSSVLTNVWKNRSSEWQINRFSRADSLQLAFRN